MTLNDPAGFKITSIPHYCEFEWTINSFSNIRQDLFSPEFYANNGCPVKWKVNLELKNSLHSNKMAIKFCMTENNASGLKVKFFCELFGGHSLITSHCFEDILPFVNKNQGIEITKPQYNRQRGWLVNGYYNSSSSDKLRLKGNITVHNCCQSIDSNLYLPNGNIPQLQIDLKTLLKSQQLTDVALHVGNEVVRAHKVVLCARSPVFRKMFEQDFKESIHSIVEIEDIEMSVLETFLEFLYTGVVKESDFQTVTGLYSAADKYKVKTLQITCCETLISCISDGTVTVILKLADMHNDSKLKENAVAYICDHFPEVEPTTEWGKLIETDPRLASYALRRVSTSMLKYKF